MGKREKLYILLLLTTLFSYFMRKGVSNFYFIFLNYALVFQNFVVATKIYNISISFPVNLVTSFSPMFVI